MDGTIENENPEVVFAALESAATCRGRLFLVLFVVMLLVTVTGGGDSMDYASHNNSYMAWTAVTHIFLAVATALYCRMATDRS